MQEKNVMKVLIISVRRFDFEDKENGKRIQGAKICYIPGEPVFSENNRGFEPCFVNSDFYIFDQITKLPGVYDVEFDLNHFRNNVSIRFINANLVNEVKFSVV